MNIKTRINARKVLLSLLCQKFSAWELSRKDSIISEIVDIDRDFHFVENVDQAKQDFSDQIVHYYDNNNENMNYIIEQFFDRQKKDGIDTDYVIKMMEAVPEYYDDVKRLVNTYATSFGFDDMDMIDRILFVIGYTEHKIFATPKEILLNEMVELSKRYGDDGTSKLVNGILHKMIGDSTTSSTPNKKSETS